MRRSFRPLLPMLASLLCVGNSTPRQSGSSYPAPVAGNFTIRNFSFASGETLPSLRLHYLTIGTPRRDASGVVGNAVLILHGTMGTGGNFLSDDFAGALFGPGQALDATKYFIVLPDSIGHGESSKPSDGLRMKFPRYTYADMVDAQYRLLTDGLKINRLFMVMGGSMGGMLTWVWGERYPDFMNALVPMSCLPTQIAGRNRILRKVMMDSIRNDPEWNNGDYVRQPRGLASAFSAVILMTSGAVHLQKAAPTRDDADRYLDEQLRSLVASVDANDMLYQFDASRDYDPRTLLERIVAPVLAINAADDDVNPPELGLMEPLIARVKRGRYLLVPVTSESLGHGTLSLVSTWEPEFKAFLADLKSPSSQ